MRCPKCDHSKWMQGQCPVVYGNDGPCNCMDAYHFEAPDLEDEKRCPLNPELPAHYHDAQYEDYIRSVFARLDTLARAYQDRDNSPDTFWDAALYVALARLGQIPAGYFEEEDGTPWPNGNKATCHVFTSCTNPVVSFRSDEEMGAIPYCAEHDKPDMPEAFG